MADHDVDPEVLLADRGYNSDAIRDDVLSRGGEPEIPTKKNRRVQHSVNRALYALRNRIERCINRLKNSRRVANPIRPYRQQLPRLRPARRNPAMDQLCPRDLA